jgi:hypothetical protein
VYSSVSIYSAVSTVVTVQVIFSKYSDLLPKEVLSDYAPELQKPDEEAVK